MARPKKNVGEALTLAVKDLLNNGDSIADIGTILGVLGQDTTRWLDNLKRECSSIEEFLEVALSHGVSPYEHDPESVDIGKKTRDYDSWPRYENMPREQALKQIERWRKRKNGQNG